MTQAIILCAGAGTRLGELTKYIPKPMIEFNGKPFLQYIIEHYRDYKIKDIVIPVGYKSEKIKSCLGDGDEMGVKIKYAESSVEAETGGSFKRAIKYIHDEYFFVQFGDVFFPLDYPKLIKKLKKENKKALVVVSMRERIIEDYEDKNDFIIGKKGLILGYDRGNKSGKANVLNGGIFLFRKDIINYRYPDKFRLEEFLFKYLVSEKEATSFKTKEIPYDIGNIKKIERFKEYIHELSKNGNVGKV